MSETKAFLIDACVMMDALLPFRPRHSSAFSLFREFEAKKTEVYVPAHAYAEYAVTCIVHFKNEPEKLTTHPIRPAAFPNLPLQVIAIDQKLVDKVLVPPLPDLKSADMLYFLIARHGDLTLVTEDDRLRKVSLKGGLRAFSLEDALAHIRSETKEKFNQSL